MNAVPGAAAGPARPATLGAAGQTSGSAEPPRPARATQDAPAPFDPAAAWSDALAAAAVFAIDPHGIGGVRLHAAPGPVRDAWFARLGQFLALGTVVRRVPSHVDAARLLGGLDLAATLRAGRPVAEQGLLALADQGVLALSMAERVRADAAALMCSALDAGVLRIERDGLSLDAATRIALIACDEGQGGDEQPPPGLVERLGLWLDLSALTWRDVDAAPSAAGRTSAERLDGARAALPSVQVPETIVEALCGACMALGIDSMRVPLLAMRVARAAAALDGAIIAGPEHAAFAARLVLAPRARRLPPAGEPPEQAEPEQQPEQQAEQDPDRQTPPPEAQRAEPPPSDDAAADADPPQDDGDRNEASLADVVLDAARAALPPDLLAALSRGMSGRPGAATAGRTGIQVRAMQRGRPVGTRRGELRDGARLHVLETLRAAAPWQGIRGRSAPRLDAGRQRRRVQVRREDFRIVRFSQRSQTTVIFVVDASGSAAVSRLAEAKGAVELFLADCYVRRDQVALIAFRGTDAQLLLPPTRSLARARRCLAGVPGGGGTPVAAGLRAAAALVDAVKRRGDVPLVVMLTDGKANVALDGRGGRDRASVDAQAMARVLRSRNVRSLLIDFSLRAREEGVELARQMGARYLALPRADSALLAQAAKVVRLENS